MEVAAEDPPHNSPETPLISQAATTGLVPPVGSLIFQTNVTSLDRAKIRYLLGLEAKIILVQEHRLRGKKLFDCIKKLKTRFFVICNAAMRTEKGGTSGGVMILVQKHMTLLPSLYTIDKTSSFWVHAIIRLKNFNFSVFCIYLHPENEALNMKTLFDVEAAIDKTLCPYFIGGGTIIETQSNLVH